MSRTVIEVQAMLPQRSSYQYIQIGSAAAVLESGHSHTDMALKYQSKVLFLLLCQLAHCDGPGYIRGSLPVLAAGVNKEESFGFYFCTVIFCRRIIVHSCTWPVGADSLKAQIQTIRIFHSEFPALHRSTVFCNLPARHIFLQPINNPAHCSGVFDMGNLQIFHFHGILISLENG